MTEYYCSAHDEQGRQFGSFTVMALDMCQALSKASIHSEVQIRPTMTELRVLPLTVARERRKALDALTKSV